MRIIVFERQLLRLTSLPTRESVFAAPPICRGDLLYGIACTLAAKSGYPERSRRSGPVRKTRDQLFFQRIPGRSHAESVCDVQRKIEIRKSLAEGRGAGVRLYRDGPLRDH